MESLNRKILVFHLLGIIFTNIAGSFLHFVYEMSGSFKPLALIGAVNESTWEHLKIGFWPAAFFAVLEYIAYGKKNKNFWLAKALCLYTIPFLIIILFYGYTFFMHHNLFLDISIFVLAVIAAYYLSYKILVSDRDFSRYRIVAIILIIAALLAFSLLTYFPPKNFLFLDPQTGSYGIIE
ncbi:MAG: DUF6512 family protein [Candidatus Aminicenantaceae bacterium]